jgi:hypothetical protein
MSSSKSTSTPDTFDYHQEEIKFWRSKVSAEELVEFLDEHRVEVLVQADTQYHCYIDYKEGDGSDGIGLTFLGALLEAIYRYKNT